MSMAITGFKHNTEIQQCCKAYVYLIVYLSTRVNTIDHEFLYIRMTLKTPARYISSVISCSLILTAREKKTYKYFKS